MTAQFERDQIARGMRTRRLYALVAAAGDALSAIEDPALRAALRAALEPYDRAALIRDVAYYDRLDADRAPETFNISQHFPYGGPLVTPPLDGRPGGWDYPAHFDPMTGKDKDR